MSSAKRLDDFPRTVGGHAVSDDYFQVT
jgi:hypothetical protein